MDSLRTSLSNLDQLLATGVIAQPEYDSKRQELVSSFVGADAGGVPAGGVPQYAATPAGRGRGGGWGRGGPMGGRRGGYGGGRFAPYVDPGMADSPTVKVQPLDVATTDGELSAALSVFGQIATTKMNQGDPPYGYVTFTDMNAANAAVAGQSVMVRGMNASIRRARARRGPPGPMGHQHHHHHHHHHHQQHHHHHHQHQHQHQPFQHHQHHHHHHHQARPRPPGVYQAPPSNGIGIFNLPVETTEQQMVELLSQFAGYKMLKMVTDKLTNHFKGYLFAYFDTVDSATNAKNQLAGLVVGEKTADIKYAAQSL